MDIATLQHDAWEIAEEKGLHDTLDHASVVGPREQALLHMMPLYGLVSCMTQILKRHGLTSESLIEIAGCATVLGNHLLQMCHALRLSLQQPQTIPNSRALAACVRLALVHTEVDEAAEHAARLDDDLTDDEAALLTEEVADGMIRYADLAHGLKQDLTTAIARVMAQNTQRPYKYGTPEEGLRSRVLTNSQEETR